MTIVGVECQDDALVLLELLVCIVDVKNELFSSMVDNGVVVGEKTCGGGSSPLCLILH